MNSDLSFLMTFHLIHVFLVISANHGIFYRIVYETATYVCRELSSTIFQKWGWGRK